MTATTTDTTQDLTVMTITDAGRLDPHLRTFSGRWLVPPDQGNEAAIAVTAQGRIAVYFQPDDYPPALFHYDRLEDLEELLDDDDLIRQAAAELGQEWPFRLTI